MFRKLLKFLKFFLLFLFLCVFASGVFSSVYLLVLYNRAKSEIPDKAQIMKRFKSMEERSEIYSSDGTLLATLFLVNREYRPLSEIPDSVKLAVIAVEDSDFLTHHGISLKGIVRAAICDVFHLSRVQGASTITQQLVRNVFLTPEKTFLRKVKEILISFIVESEYSKDEILELYLNTVFLGRNSYGFAAASESFFSKDISEITVPEAALLAGLLKAPSYYDPVKHPERALARRNLVLRRMWELGYITDEEYRRYKNSPLELHPKPLRNWDYYYAPYFVRYVVRRLKKDFGFLDIYTGGLKIYTTLDLDLQKTAEEILKDWIEKANEEGKDVGQGALLCMDPRSGEILAYVGGVSYEDSKYDHISQAKRQPGSAFKPFVYLTALSEGLPFDLVMSDSPAFFDDGSEEIYVPHNHDEQFWGPLKLSEALAHSRNVVAIKVIDSLPIKKVIQVAHRLGIRQPLEPVLTLTLGTTEVPPIEMAVGFSVFANGGYRVDPYPIIKVVGRNGQEYLYTPHRTKVIPATMAFLMTSVLRLVVERGTGVAAKLPVPCAGKTGTTSNTRDAWFIGYTDSVLSLVWVGNDDNTPMNGVFGGNVPAKIWHDFMMKVIERYPPGNFPPSYASPEFVELCGGNGSGKNSD